jgi:hypothetical protein
VSRGISLAGQAEKQAVKKSFDHFASLGRRRERFFSKSSLFTELPTLCLSHLPRNGHTFAADNRPLSWSRSILVPLAIIYARSEGGRTHRTPAGFLSVLAFPLDQFVETPS